MQNQDQVVQIASALSPEFINSTLDLYLPEHRQVLAASYADKCLICCLGLSPYAATKRNLIRYLTASQLMTQLSQAGFLMVRCLIEGEALISDDAGFSSAEFFKYRNNGGIVFLDVSSKFYRKIWISEDSYYLLLRFERISYKGATGIAKISYEDSQGRLRGHAVVAIIP